jgi:hypothetical protein
MVALSESNRFIGFPKNRYELLNNMESFLRLNGVNLEQAFQALFTCHDGYLIYTFGNLEIQLTRGFGVTSGSHSLLEISVEYDNGEIKQNVE